MKNKIKDLICNSVVLTIGGFTTVFENEYNEGELEQCNEWEHERKIINLNLDNMIKANIITELKSYIKNELFLDDLTEANYDIFDDRLCTSRLVDNDNMEATTYDIDEWKKGNKVLYSQNINITLELNGIDLNSEMLGEILSMNYES